MNYTITNPEIFNSQNVRVDIVGDNIEIWYTRNGREHCVESWGEHGPNDFVEYGFRVGK